MTLSHFLSKHKGETLKQAETLARFLLLSASSLPGSPLRSGSHSNVAHLLLAPEPIPGPGGGLALVRAAAGTACKHETGVSYMPWSIWKGWAQLA